MIAAEGEQKASKALREASLVMAESSSALQLRYLQVYTSYSQSPVLVVIDVLSTGILNENLGRK